MSRVGSNWTFAPIIEASSGRPFNIIVGEDRNFDFGTTTDRPLAVPAGNAGQRLRDMPASVQVFAHRISAARLLPERHPHRQSAAATRRAGIPPCSPICAWRAAFPGRTLQPERHRGRINFIRFNVAARIRYGAMPGRRRRLSIRGSFSSPSNCRRRIS